MDKCIYCHKKIDTPYTLILEKHNYEVSCCSDECVQKVTSYLNYFEKTKLYFYIIISLSVGLILTGAIVEAVTKSLSLLAMLMAGGFVLFGIAIILFPFATPESFNKWGIKKTIKIIRLVGIGIILLGPVLALFLLQ